MISWLGNLEESPSNPKRYDAYYNTVDGCSYIYDGANWTLLASKGDKGDAGTNGRSIVWKGSYATAPQNPEKLWAYYNTKDGCSYIYDGTKWTNLTSKGEKGEDGRSIVWKGSLPNHPQNPEALWAYFNESDGCSYIYDGEKWTLLSSKGDKGETGSSGADGRSIVWKGTFYTHPENPQELWTYYNATDGNAYIYSNGSWSLLMQNLAVNYDTPTIIGTVSSNGDSYSVSGVYIKVVDEASNNTVWNSLPAADGDFAVSGLDASKTYTLHFSSKRLSDVNITNSKALTATTEDVSFGAIRTGVSPLGGKAQDLGSIVLSPNGTVHGSVVHGGDSKTSEGVDVFLDGTSYATKTDSNGEYTIKDVLQGSYSIVFRKDGYITQSRDVVVFSSNPSEVPSLEVPSVSLVMGSCTLKGTVGYEDRTDMSGINVVLIGSGGDVCRTSMTGKDGSFSFEGVSPDTYTIRAGADGYTTVDRRISISMGESYVVPMGSLTNLCGSITGIVTTNDSGLKSGVKVKATASNGERSYETSTDEAGLYTLSSVLHGDYVLTFEKDGYETYATNVTVEPGRISTTDVQLKSRFGSIRVIVSFVDKDDPTGIVVNVYRNGTLIFSATTTSTGIMVIANMPIGDGYSVIASSDGYGSSGEDKVTVSSGMVSELNLQKLSNRYGSIKGRVVDANGDPIESATVCISSNDGNSYTLTTSKDGTFSKTDVAVGTYTVSADKADFLTTTLPQTYTVEPSLVTEIKDDIVLTSRYAYIAGRVQYADKEDSSNISVTIEDDKGRTLGTVVTGGTGSYSFKVESGTYYIRANAQGYFESSKVVNVVSGNGYTVELEDIRSRYGSMKGRVVDATGSPIGAATVNISSDDGNSYTLATDNDGTFCKADVAIGTYSISVSKVDYLVATLPVAYTIESSLATEIKDDIVLVSKYADITGKAFYVGEDDASNITVTIEDDKGVPLKTVVTGTSGSYSFKVEPGAYCIRARAQGCFETSKSFTVIAGNSYVIDVDGLVLMYGSVSGKVQDQADTAIEGATVRLESSDDVSYTLMTGNDGLFSSEQILIGDYSVYVGKSGFQTVVLPLKYRVESSKKTSIGVVSLTSEYADINGSVGYSDRTDPSGILVTIEDSTGKTIDSFTVGSDGTFSFRVSAGTFAIKANANGYAETSKSITVVVGKTYSIDLGKINTLYGSITGKVVDADGDAVSGAVVNLTNMDGTEESVTLSTNENGEFSSSTVPIGTYTISITKGGYIDVVCNDVPIVGGRTYDIGTKTLVSGTAGITGRVVLEGSSNYSGVTVSATSLADSSKLYTTTTTDDGAYYFMSIETGAYSLKIQKDGYITDSTQQVSLTAGDVSQVKTITLKSESSTVTGSVSLEGSSSSVGVNVLLKSTENETAFSTTTDYNGRYMFNNVKAGKYELILSKDGYANVSVKDLYVEKGVEKTLDAIVMNIAFTSVRGRVSLEGRTDLSGALVTATNISRTDIIYSAITNSQGVFTFAKMYSGEYSIAVSCSGYSTATLPTVNVVDDTPIDVGSVSLKIERGTIAGIARLEGYSDYSGIKVSILGTDYVTTTAEDGSYSFTVPAGNYPGGLRFEYGDFETTSYASTIPVLTNSTYAIPDIQMKCLNVPMVYGKVTIYGLTRAEYDGITVKIAELPSFSYTTDKDGRYSFEHVPVGTYTLEFTRENARKVTKIVAVEPSPYIEIEDIELIPDAATLYGNISMEGVADYSGVTVRITTPGSVELKTMTNAAGYWYIGNVVASKGHTITFEKDGWDSQSYDIAADTYEPLALVDYNKEQPVVMKDTTAPVITNISANIGRSTENGREVYLYLYTNEKGSGIRWIQGTTADSFDGVEEQAYYNPFTLLIPDEVGEYTLHVRVKDGAGNVSDTTSTNIVVKNDKVQLSGALSGEKLHLTKNEDGKPYVITDNVLVPKGETLVIDPGVEIQVQGAFYIQVEGSINAVGTEDERIKIYGVDSGVDKWKGINFMANSGNVISYADISGMAVGIYGYCDLDHVLMSSKKCALGYMEYSRPTEYLIGDVLDSEINGGICQKNGSVLRNSIVADKIYLTKDVVFQNNFSGVLEGVFSSCTVDNNSFDSEGVSDKTLSFEGCSVFSSEFLGRRKLSLKDCLVRYSSFTDSNLTLSGGLWKNDTLNGCSFDSYDVFALIESNLISCGDIRITTTRSSKISLDMRGNYWGADKTLELYSKTNDDNDDLSFIFDYNDKDKSNFNVSKVLYSGYKSSAIKNCGYQDKDYGTTGSYSGYSIGDEGPAGGLVFYDKGFYSDGWRYLEAAPSDIGKFVFGYYRPDKENNNVVGTATAIGSGKNNTENLKKYMDINGEAYSDTSGEAVKKYAAKACLDYGEYGEWFLPSKDELNLMYENLYRKGLGSFADDPYWSSSEYSGLSAWWQYCVGGYQYSYRSNGYRVRPVRAF